MLQENDYDVIAISSEFMGEETVLKYDTSLYPEAIYLRDPPKLDTQLKQEYTLFRPYPEGCRMYIYLNNKLLPNKTE